MWIAQLKSLFRIQDVVVDTWCRFIHYLLLPDGNLFPPSFHLVKAVLDVPDVSSVTRHVCPQCWELFPELDPSDHQHHLEDTCGTPGCTQPRFDVDLTGKGVPVRSVFYFGEEASLKDLLLQPGLLMSIQEARAAAIEDKTSFINSPAGKALDKAYGNKITNPDPGEVVLLFGLGVFSPPHLCRSAYWKTQ